MVDSPLPPLLIITINPHNPSDSSPYVVVTRSLGEEESRILSHLEAPRERLVHGIGNL